MAISPLERRRLGMMVAKDPLTLARLAAASRGGMGGMAQGAGTLADLAGLAPPPQAKVVTPAAPAPVAQGQEIKAPALAPTPQVGPGVQTGKAVPSTPGAIEGDLAARAAALADQIRAAGVVSPEREKVFASQEKRYGEELTDLEEDKKRAGWEALAMAGMKMAQSQSPYFMSALATGMEAGLTGYNEKKAAAAERKARIQEKQENIVLGREAAKDAAEARASQRVTQELALRKALAEGTITADQLAQLGQTFGSRVEAANLAPEVLRNEMTYRNRAGEAALINATTPSGGGGGLTANALLTASIRLQSDRNRYAAQLAQPGLTTAEKQALTQNIASIDAQLAQLGMGGGAAPAPAGGAPDIVSIVPVGQNAPPPRQGPPAAAPPAQKPAAPPAQPKPKVDPQAVVARAVRQAQAESRQYADLPRASTPWMRLTGEKADIRKANNAAVDAAKNSGLPQYRKRQNETYAQWDSRLRRELNLPAVD